LFGSVNDAAARWLLLWTLFDVQIARRMMPVALRTP
jgi:hypothetical protein